MYLPLYRKFPAAMRSPAGHACLALALIAALAADARAARRVAALPGLGRVRGSMPSNAAA
jgi:hypothetical protein